MTRKRVDDEKYGKLQRKLDEFARRIDEGTLDYAANMPILQAAIEGDIVNRIRTGGMVLKGPMTVCVRYPGFEALRKKERHIPEECKDLFPEQPYIAQVLMYFGHFDFFGENQPSTADALSLFLHKGYLAASACELYYADLVHHLDSYGRDIIACGVPTGSGRLFHVDTHEGVVGGRYKTSAYWQPYWSYCYRFALVKK